METMPRARALVVAALALAACSDSSGRQPLDLGGAPDLPAVRDNGPGVDRSASPEASVDTSPPPDSAPGPCPPLMVLVQDTFCVDRYEAALEEQVAGGGWQPASPYLTVGTRTVRAVPAKGLVPQGYISGAEAAAACAAAGKRLCNSAEWLAACRGPQQTTYPYGDTYQPGACNDDYPGHPVVDFFGTSTGVWDAQHMNDPGINQQPGTVAQGGAHPGCVSHFGVFDLHGNLHEWVSDAAGTFRGGFYADAKINGDGCLYDTTAHGFTYHDYSTGFRCCKDRAP